MTLSKIKIFSLIGVLFTLPLIASEAEINKIWCDSQNGLAEAVKVALRVVAAETVVSQPAQLVGRMVEVGLVKVTAVVWWAAEPATVTAGELMA